MLHLRTYRPYLGLTIPLHNTGGIDDSLETWHEIMDVNLHGAYYCARAAGQVFRQQRSGNLILTASMSGHIANVPQRQVRMLTQHIDASAC